MKKKETTVLRLLSAALALMLLSAILSRSSAAVVKTDYYETQTAAARQLEACFAAVQSYKKSLGIPLSDDDIHATGMIGLPYTGITTTTGALEAKRTAAWPDMAARCVRICTRKRHKERDLFVHIPRLGVRGNRNPRVLWYFL